MKNKIITLVFCILIVVMSISEIAMPDKFYSSREKRKLEQYPVFSFEALFSGEYGDDLETYLSDQIPFRDKWVSMKTYIELSLGKKESGGVFFGKDKYLLDKFTSYDMQKLQNNAEDLHIMQEKFLLQGISMKTILVPTSAQVLSDKLPAFASVADYEEICKKLQENQIDLVDIYKILKEHDSEDIYYRTDHHWTSLGAYYAYVEWCNEKGMEPISEENWTKEVLSDTFRGTSWNKVQLSIIPPEQITAWYISDKQHVNYNDGKYITDSIYERKYLEGSDQYAVFLNSNQPLTVINGNGKSGRLLIIKDSYGNTFSQFALEEYAEVHVIDLRFFRGDIYSYVEQHEITDALMIYGAKNFVEDPYLSLFS